MTASAGVALDHAEVAGRFRPRLRLGFSPRRIRPGQGRQEPSETERDAAYAHALPYSTALYQMQAGRRIGWRKPMTTYEISNILEGLRAQG